MITEDIKKYIKENLHENQEDAGCVMGTLRTLNAMNMEGMINFDVIFARDNEGDDYFRLEYFSPKLQKAIILDYDVDFNGCSDDRKFVSFIEKTEGEVSDFENRISFKI